MIFTPYLISVLYGQSYLRVVDSFSKPDSDAGSIPATSTEIKAEPFLRNGFCYFCGVCSKQMSLLALGIESRSGVLSADKTARRGRENFRQKIICDQCVP